MRLITVGLASLVAGIALGQNPEPKEFFTALQGEYKILRLNGEVPKEEDSAGDVYVDTDETVLTMPYCEPGVGCLGGYIYFPYNKTSIQKSQNTDGSVLYKIAVTGPDGVVAYSWEVHPSSSIFTHPRFRLSNGTFIQLTYELTKAP